jgi:uncharacterized RDD family membrane protein YckC
MEEQIQNAQASNLPDFSKRFIAFVLDLAVLGVVMLMMHFTVPYIAPFLVWVAYKTLFECSAVQATPGKRAMDLIVTDSQGKRLTLGKSLLRTLVAFISVFTGFMIYLVALFTPRRQTLHDLVADTLVVPGHPDGEAGRAWLDEVKLLFEWIHALFNNNGKSFYTEKEKLDLLEKLNSLRASGALTEDEYQTRKRAILAEG